ncbi:MAG: Holliday junction resolvase RuvX [Candidatus Hydrogenedentota bacterium]
MTLERVLGLDIGDVRIGVAVSDPLGSMALPRDTVQRTDLKADIKAIGAIAEETGARRVVVGLPLNQHGKPGPQAERVLEFATALEEGLGLPVTTQDERFSTAAAERTLIGADMRRKKRKQNVDKLAAHHILQSYLDRTARGATQS